MKKGHLICLATINDLEAITGIYNYAISSTFETADTVPFNWKRRKGWFNSHIPEKYPVFVYKIHDTVAGWVSISPYREGRKALRLTVEVSYYVHPAYKRQGIGSSLLAKAVTESTRLEYRTIIAIVLDKNENSIKLLKKNGFRKWGHLPDIADFDGAVCGHVYYGFHCRPLP